MLLELSCNISVLTALHHYTGYVKMKTAGSWAPILKLILLRDTIFMKLYRI